MFLQGDGRPDAVCPAGILKTDWLDFLGNFIGVEARVLTNFPAFLHGLDAVLLEDSVDFVDSSLITFK
jgi:hypothetical protein